MKRIPRRIFTEEFKKEAVVRLGSIKDVTKSFYAISVERKLTHPVVVAISEAAKHELFL